tara:strand:+ start:446 stop:712 length:267 start_codon:yes stop_codon:yes gene_type:complete
MNQSIIYQHKEIFMIFELLLDKIAEHTKYEELLLDERNESKPDNHRKVDKKINNHKIYHKQLIKNLEELYKNFELHIVTMDSKHMHKL